MSLGFGSLFFLSFLVSKCYVISLAWALISAVTKGEVIFIFSYVYCFCVGEQDGTLIIF